MKPITDEELNEIEAYAMQHGDMGDVCPADVCAQAREANALRIALADAIRSPMGAIPDSALGLVTQEELDAAEKRRASR